MNKKKTGDAVKGESLLHFRFFNLYYIEIQPNAFATELIRIIAAKIGHRYWIIK